MISKDMVKHFVDAARALASGKKDTGFTGNGIRKLDFYVSVPDEANPRKTIKRVFTALEQNTDKLSTPAQRARSGHVVIQIRDNDKGILLGNVEVDENRFISYESVPMPVDIEEIEEVLGEEAIDSDEIEVTAARTSLPVASEPLPLQKRAPRRAA